MKAKIKVFLFLVLLTSISFMSNAQLAMTVKMNRSHYLQYEVIYAKVTIRNNSGDFQVAIDVRPKLRKGHNIRLEVDGQVAQSSMSSFMSLANIDRGAHTLVAYIIGSGGKAIKTTAPVTIHLHRAVAR